MSTRGRAARGIVPIEVAAVLVVAVLVPVLPIPPVAPLLLVASASQWYRGTGFGERLRGPEGNRSMAGPPRSKDRPHPGPRVPPKAGPPLHALIGAAAGLGALVLALLVGTPFAESLTDHAVVWSSFPIVRGSPTALFAVAMIVMATAVATELVLRGWIVERVLELGRGPQILAIFVGGFAEAALADGDLTTRIGAGVFGLGLGWIYVAGGRNLTVPICARLAFQLGAVVLEAMRLVG